MEATAGRSSNKYILVVDDDEMVRSTIRAFLKKIGYIPKVASNAFEALKILDKHPFDLVTYGHQAGDKVLREFAKCVRETIRDNVDLVARYGGEEFIIVAPETDFSSALILAERVRNAVSQMVVKVKEKGIHITASFGVTGFDTDTPEEKISPEAVINQADKYLYQAKREGRNRVRAGKVEDN